MLSGCLSHCLSHCRYDQDTEALFRWTLFLLSAPSLSAISLELPKQWCRNGGTTSEPENDIHLWRPSSRFWAQLLPEVAAFPAMTSVLSPKQYPPKNLRCITILHHWVSLSDIHDNASSEYLAESFSGLRARNIGGLRMHERLRIPLEWHTHSRRHKARVPKHCPPRKPAAVVPFRVAWYQTLRDGRAIPGPLIPAHRRSRMDSP